MQILIPISSKSSFFPKGEFFFPKPLIEVAGEIMISRVIASFSKYFENPTFIFVINEEDSTMFSLGKTLSLLAGDNIHIVEKKNETMGATCSALLAIDVIDLNESLIIVNSDQIIEENIFSVTNFFVKHSADAGVITFPSVHPRWSYAVLDSNGNVLQTFEKSVASDNAIAGFYYFKESSTFVDCAKKSILKGSNVDNIFYISAVINEVILAGGLVSSYPISLDCYHSFYSPAKIAEFENGLRDGMAAKQFKSVPNKINLLVPAAGLGSRFLKEGWKTPKPFINVNGKPMINQVLDNVGNDKSITTVIIQQELLDQRPEYAESLREKVDNLMALDKYTEGTASTVLFARKHINNSLPLLIANSDQIVDFDVDDYINDCHRRGLDGSILVFRDHHKDPKWSFAKLDENGLVVKVAEKDPISDLATVGIYYFSRGSDFVDGAIDMIVANDRVNGEFYTCPVYNYMITSGAKIGIYEINHDSMSGIGTPNDLESYLQSIGAPASSDSPSSS